MKGTTGKTLNRNGEHWYNFIVTKTTNIPGDMYIELKITSGEEKGKYSVVLESELDDTVIFD